MKKSDIPLKFPIPFAAMAGGPFITPTPTESQIGTAPGRASLTDGFVPLNMQPIAAGGIPPFGQDMNGIINRSTAWDRWLSVGGPVYYDADWATDSGGYPAECVIRSRVLVGKLWMSTVDDNTSDPDAFGANWITPNWAMGTGFVKGNPIPNDLQDGWVPMRAGYTLGAPGSSATYAAANAVFLYVLTWNKFSNVICPVTGGRGANALADFNALKPIQIYDMSGTGMVGNDAGTGRLAGINNIFGNATTTGSQVGENFHALTLAENGPHTHTGTTGTESANHQHNVNGSTGGMSTGNPHTHSTTAQTGPNRTGGGDFNCGDTVPAVINPTSIDHVHAIALTSGSNIQSHTHNITTASSGSGTAHNTVSRSSVVEWQQHL